MNIVFQEYEETCLFTKHESLQGDSPRVHPKILKCSLHSLVTKGIRLVGFATRAMVCTTSFWIHSHSREDVWSYAHTFSFSFCLLFLYLIIFTLNYSLCSVIITLWSSCTYFTAVSDGCWRINTSIGFLRHSLSSVNGRQVQPRKSSKMVWHICIHHTPGFSVVLYFITYFASYLALRYVISNYLRNEYMDSEFS